MRLIPIFCAALIACSHAALASSAYTYTDLVGMLTDMERLAVLPAQGETRALASSYDRSSSYDEKTGTYVNWHANDDCSGVIGETGQGLLMADIKGPGCIWRIFSASPGAGRVKIYLDDSPQPAVDLPFRDYFNHRHEPFTYPALVYESGEGKNCYVPIPFQKSCRVIAEKNWGSYYSFAYTRFPEETKLPTFKRNLAPDERLALRTTDFFLRTRLGNDPHLVRPGQQNLSVPIKIKPGEKRIVARIDGERAITHFGVRGDLKAVSDDGWRNVLLNIYWDGETSPSVWSPLGDFFGTGPGLNDYKSLPLGVTDERLYSYWYMPFADGAIVELVNEADSEFRATIDLSHAPLSRPVSELGRFHAKWHRNVLKSQDPGRGVDWTLLDTQGRGRYCGVMLEVWNPRGGWWGDGDAKFFVDGEKFPSTFGTGTDNYFGYASGKPALFHRAFHSQTINESNEGHVSANRWHIADSAPFQQSFHGCIGKHFLNDRPTRYAAIPYWYLDTNGIDPYLPVPKYDRRFYVKPEN